MDSFLAAQEKLPDESTISAKYLNFFLQNIDKGDDRQETVRKYTETFDPDVLSQIQQGQFNVRDLPTSISPADASTLGCQVQRDSGPHAASTRLLSILNEYTGIASKIPAFKTATGAGARDLLNEILHFEFTRADSTPFECDEGTTPQLC